ncbi:bacterio-opsin activator domain-containing protein [Halorarius halobius]|uniref:bacterio-opsin activator domain-containing protein n=1 Tax=Halorarius halobius TaxID=2962671 RepID=UPI0020CDFE17|nr:bacterio-opsin activator domain-containing protein [Halorarius halobius]
MTSAAPSTADVLETVDALGPPGTPVTTPEVAEGFDCTQRTIYNRLEALVEEGPLLTKKVGANSRVWWRPVDAALRRNGGPSAPGVPVSLRDGQSPPYTADGEMAERIREFDWTETPLGPIEEWPAELRTAVDIMLGADEAIGIYWGDDLTLLYNDLAGDVIGNKHPDALGQPARDVFPEAWDTLGPVHEQVMAGGGATRLEELLLPLERTDEIEDIWWDTSYNPIPLADGSVGGVFNVAVDVTERVRLENNLRESKEQLEVALNAAGMGTWEWDLETRTVDGDDRMLSLFDLPPADEPVPVERFLAKASDAGADHAEETMASAFDPGEEVQDEVELEGVDPPRWISWRGRASEDDPTVLRGVSFDITERKQAEIERERAMDALQESEERYRTLFDSLNESMQEGFCVVELLEEGEAPDEASNRDETAADRSEPGDYRFVEANPAFEELTGLTDVVGARRSDLDGDGDFPGFDLCAEVARTGESRRVETTGEPLVDGWFDVRVFPYGGPGSRQVAVLIDDITGRKEANAAVRESERRLRLATGIADIAVFEWDLETDRVSGNERMHELFGYDEHETIVGEELLEERIHPDDIESVTDQLEEVFEPASDGTYEFEFRARRPDGSDRWVRTHGEVFFEDDGNDRRAVRVHGTGIDITEQKQREERQEFLLRFSDALRAQPDAESIKEEAVELLAEHLDLDRCWISEVFEEQGYSTVGPEQIRPDLPEMGGVFQLSEYPETMRQLATQPMVVEDATNDPRFSDSERELLAGYHLRSLLVAPLRKGEEDVVWALAAANAEPRDWTDGERALLEDAAERTWAAAERTRAEQALAESNQSLERLNDASRELIDTDPETISDRVAELVVDILDVEYAALWGYDAQTGDLELDSEHAAPGTDFDAIRPVAVSHEQVWETFVGDEIDVENALDVADGDPWPSGLGSRVFAPLGRHGVVCIGSEDSETFDDRLLDLLQMVVSTIKTAWDRAESEQEVARRNEELTRLDRLNSLIREIDKALVAADTREEIDEAVCERLASSDLYEFAWVGEHDPATGVVEPRAWAGVDSAYLEDLTITIEDNPANRDPVARAVRTGDLQVVADIATSSDFAPWREATLERGVRSLICIPLVYDDAAYGVLTVYADRPQSDEDERNQDVLSELGDTIAHTLNARETRATLQTDSVVELTLRFEDADTPLVRLAREAACTIEHQGFIPRASGKADVYFIARGCSPEELQATAERSLAFDDLDCLTDGADGPLFRARVSDPTLAARVTDEGAVVRSITIDAGVATVVLDVPHTVAVREFLDRLRQWNSDFELRARQSRERPLKTRQTFTAALEDHLTDRQREVLQTAYLSGFFETPRVSNGQEVTELLGVSQPTFSEHLRAAERTLCEVLFETASHTESLS